jgi:colanic acid/amylovoran biosynthesis glycosyltransferase
MATGLPVLSTLHSGIPELVRDGSGFLVPERDVEALAARLAELVNNPAQWAAIGAAGRSVIEHEFDIRVLNQRLADFLHGSKKPG